MDKEISLYESETTIHAREVDGIFDQMRSAITIFLLGIYYVGPWLRWDNRQAILFDLPARKFYVFGLTFWPQDFIYLAWLLVICAVGLFLATALAGRVWCGYACPQTVWINAFVWIERLTEGNRSKRIKLDKSPWNKEKIFRRGSKQTLWILFALWTGFVFVGYFTPVRELDDKVVSFTLGGWETFWILFYSLATYGNAGIMREQVCKYMCPYARFQSAMFDRDSLVISYDESRGEPRGGRSRKNLSSDQKLGDCIDCTLCVQACPVGIDIRDGLQYECIACAACIDACDSVMDKMNYAPRLIQYTTQNRIDGKPSRVIRTRTIIYTVLLAILLTGLAGALTNRHVLRMDAIRDRNALYRELSDGRIENVYTLKVLNKSDINQPLSITVSGISSAELDTDPDRPVALAAELTTITVRVNTDPQQMPGGGHDIEFNAASETTENVAAIAESRFFLPATNRDNNNE